ncbi:MAG: TonB-dependent receptor [Ferruginibacter sp.]|nr:TonB-dependent receptor [Cytophagales bacterium]
MKTRFLLLLAAAWLPSALLAQSYQVTGKVTDRATGEPLPGVNVALLNTTQGTVTDVDGSFVLPNLAAQSYRIGFSFIGYKTQALVVRVPQEGELTPALESDVIGLDAVVVTGQGLEVAKRRLSTNVSTIGRAQIERSPATRLDQLLQAQLPNAQIRLNTSQPGATSMIRSRGVVSAAVSATPVIYVDGVRMDNLNTAATLSLNTSGNRHNGDATGSVADIPLENIDRIEYISGGAATTLYGSDAANGVIQIFTRRGGAGTTRVSLETNVGAETPTTDFYYFDRTADLLFRDGLYQQYRLAMDGGNQNFGYSFSGSFLDTEGTRIHRQNANRRYDFRTSFKAKPNAKITYLSSFGFSNSRFSRVRNGNAGGYTGLWFAEAGQSAPGFGFNNRLDDLNEEEYGRVAEFVSKAEALQNYGGNTNRFQTSQSLEFTPLPQLRLKGTAGLDFRSSSEKGIETNEYLIHTKVVAANTENRGRISRYERRFAGLTLEATAQHTANWRDFSFISTLGSQLFRNEDNQVELTGEDLREGSQLVSDASVRSGRDLRLQVVNYGIYAQENVGFREKYYLEFGLRADGNSAFGANIGLQTYPKVGLSYILSEEGFMQRIPFLSSAKLRANYGVAGNFPPPFANERTTGFSPFLNASTARFGQYGNPDLRPEKTYTFEAGTDLSLANDRFSVGFTYYHATTRDALLWVPLAPSIGEPVQLQNVGKILNRGVEIAANFAVINNQNLTLRLNASLNTLHNRVLSTGGTAPFAINGFSARTVQSLVAEGQEMGVIRGSRATFGPDGTLLESDPVAYIANPLPNTFGNLGLNLAYQSRLTFFATADYQTGAQQHSFDRQFRFNHGLDEPRVPAKALADAGNSRNALWLNVTNVFVESTDYLKVRLVGVNYSLPPKWHGKIVKGIEVGFTAVNPFNFAASSFDPEVDHSGSRDPDPNSLTGTAQNGASVGGFNYSTSSPNRQWLGNVRIRF